MGRPAQRFWILLWLVVATVLLVRTTARPGHRGVILDHLEFGRRLLHGEDPYGPWHSDPDAPARPLHSPYPPSFGLLTAPFAVLADMAGQRAARLAWGLLQVAALAAIGIALFRLPTGRAPPSPYRFQLLFALVLLLASRFVLRDTHGGGGNIVNLALCLLAFERAERGHQRSAGWLLGFSLMTKPTQVWLLPVFVLLGHRRTALHACLAAGTLLGLTLLLLRGDVGPWLRWSRGAFAIATQADAFADPALGLPPFEWMNQSLRCALARWLGTVPPELAARVPYPLPPGLGLPLPTVAAITRGFGIAILVAVLLQAWRVARRSPEPAAAPLRGADPARSWIFAAALVASLLLSPLSWKAHHVALLPALLLLLRRALDDGERVARVLLAAFVLLCGIGGELLGDGIAEFANSLYVVTAVDLSVLVATLFGSARR